LKRGSAAVAGSAISDNPIGRKEVKTEVLKTNFIMLDVKT
jgi:hypothetical protein